MLDDDDMEIVALGSNPSSCLGILALLVALAIMGYFVSQNKAECAEKHCEHGSSQLMDHRCVCLEDPK